MVSAISRALTALLTAANCCREQCGPTAYHHPNLKELFVRHRGCKTPVFFQPAIMSNAVFQFLKKYLHTSVGCLCVALGVVLPLLFALMLSNKPSMVDLTVVQYVDRLQVNVNNRGEPITLENIRVQVEDQTEKQVTTETLDTGRATQKRIPLPKFEKSGNYAAEVVLTYRSHGQRRTLTNVVSVSRKFSTFQARGINSGIVLDPLVLQSQGRYRIKNLRDFKFHLLLPDEIQVSNVTVDGRDLIFDLNTKVAEPREYSIYLILNTQNDAAGHSSEWFDARAYVGPSLAEFYLPLESRATLLLGTALLLISALLKRFDRRLVRRAIYTAGLVIFTFALFAGGSELCRHYLSSDPQNFLFTALAQTLVRWEHNDVQMFFRYLAAPLFWYVLLLHPAVLYLSRYCSTAGLRAFAVKAFFLPMVSTWTMNNAWSFYLSSAYSRPFTLQTAVSIMMLIDVLVFMLGYFIESPILKNEIKSAEPTFWGWVICICCYPPFVYYTYNWFNIPLNLVHWNATGMLRQVIQTIDSLSWIVFVLASIALGWRGSNLTSRGVVSHGPYAVVRHPAYVSKLFAWTLTAVAWGQLTFFHVIVLWAVYGMRALTEERHLGATDPEYAEYCKRVKWRMIPGVW